MAASEDFPSLNEEDKLRQRKTGIAELYGASSVSLGLQDANSRSFMLGIPSVCWCILVVELAERLVFYTLNGTQEFFLETLGIPLARAGGLNATMSTLCMVWALGASYAADSVLGRYNTIFYSGLLYVVSVVLAAVAAFPGRESIVLYLVSTLGLLPIATAGIKANISNLGADQYNTDSETGKQEQEKFFSVFYLAINLGAGVAYGFFTTFAGSGGLGVPKTCGYFCAYGSMALFMGAAVVTFCSARRRYRVQPLQPVSALTRTRLVLVAAASSGSKEAQILLVGLGMLLASILLSVAQALADVHTFAAIFAVFALAAVGTLAVVFSCRDVRWVSRGASSDETVAQDAAEVQSFLSIMPALFVGSLAFSALYNSMAFWYQQQACQMDVQMRLPFTGATVMLSGSFFNLADCLAIVTMTPVVLNFVNPFLEKGLGRAIGTGTKFGISMVIGVMSVAGAAKLEMTRRSTSTLTWGSNCAPKGVMMSELTAAWMVLPYFFMGLAEIYGMVTLMHYAYNMSPPSMRTLSSAIFFFVQAVSSGIFAVETSALADYIPDDLNSGHLEYGYAVNLLLAGGLYFAFNVLLNESQQTPQPALIVPPDEL